MSDDESIGSADLMPSPLTAVWSDSDDEKLQIDITSQRRTKKLRTSFSEAVISGREYELRLRAQFERIHPRPKWANCQVDEANAYNSTENIIQRARAVFRPEHIQMSKQRDANAEAYSQCVVQSIDWHPNGQVLSTAGFDKSLRLFQIDGKHNTKLQSLYFQDMPIHSAQFLSSSEMLITGRRSYFYSLDVESGTTSRISKVDGAEIKSCEVFKCSHDSKWIAMPGRDGNIHILDAQNKHLVSNFKMNTSCKDLAWSFDSMQLWTTGGNEMYLWDLRYLRDENKLSTVSSGDVGCVGRWVDEGAIKTTTIAASLDGKWIATGQNTGVVNIYQTPLTASSNNPTPTKTLLNLTTSIAHLQFHPSSQLLAFSSRVKKDQLRILHVGSMQVYSGWPRQGTPLGYVNEVQWSKNPVDGTGWLAVGNDKGKVGLWKVGC